MSWVIFKIASGACADVNAWLDLYNRVGGAAAIRQLPILARRMINTRQQLSDDNTAAQHQIQLETNDNTAAQHQIQLETNDNTAAQHQIKLETNDNTAAQHQIQLDTNDNTAAQHQIQEEMDRPETKLEQLGNDHWKLKTTMPKMIDLLDRVEWQSHKKAAADLLPYLKDAVYNAEDLLDEYDYYELKVKAEEGARMSGQDHLHGDAFREFFDKMKKIQGNLDHIHGQSKDLKLNKAPRKFNESIRPEKSPSPDPEIFGREKELKELVQKLGVELHTRKRKYTNASKMTELPVLPIVGLGGVGKTTMVQRICNDAMVEGHFGKDNIIWSCVSDEFDIMRLIKEILQQFRQPTPYDNLNVLMKDLARCVESKKFLLVLDDMWDDLLEDDGARWKIFCAPLRWGLQGSTILVTTRSSKVANLVGTMKEPYELKGLQDDVFWDFFKLCAFGSNSSCNDRELLDRIGKDIVPKLKGSPLAAKTLGRLLKTDLSTAHWERILESELWQLEQKETEILPVLRLSYIYLPFHLKRCFSICALYPKDYIFEREFLVDIWISQGYVEPKDASFHFDELVERSFFQKAGGTAHQSNKYVVHNLMHDMAQLVSKDECFIIRHASDLGRIPSNVRHLSIFTNGNVSCTELEIICDKKKLRSLVCNESFSRANDFAPLIDRWFRKLLKLRYLHLFGSSTVSNLPSSGLLSLDEFLTPDYLPVIKHIYVTSCDKLTSLPVDRLRGFSRLQELRIEYCPKLNIQRVMTLPPCLKKLHLDRCPSIESIEMGSSPALEHLYINDCPDLRSIGGSIALAQIPSVYINVCPGLTEVEQPFRKSRGHTGRK